MAKPVRSTVTQSDIQEYLDTQDDFALELFVYNEAVKAELDATHAGTYEDPVTKKHRQFDIRASRQWRNRRIDLAVECKALRDSFPLLVSRVPRSEGESSHSYIQSYRPGGFLPSIATGEWAPASCEVFCPSQAIYPVNAPVGKSLTQVGRTREGELTSSDADTFDKWSQALSSSATFVEAAWLGYEKSTKRKLVTMVIPVLVVSDGTLWVADYAQDGTLQLAPRQQDSIEFYIDREYVGPANLRYRVSHLHILTKSAVPQFFNRINSEEEYWNAVFPPDKFPSDGA